MDKKSLTEQDIRSKFISPAIVQAGWDHETQIREEFTLSEGRLPINEIVIYEAENGAIQVRLELNEPATTKDFSVVQTEGKRRVARELRPAE